jgi:hypothetical protein
MKNGVCCALDKEGLFGLLVVDDGDGKFKRGDGRRTFTDWR